MKNNTRQAMGLIAGIIMSMITHTSTSTGSAPLITNSVKASAGLGSQTWLYATLQKPAVQYALMGAVGCGAAWAVYKFYRHKQFQYAEALEKKPIVIKIRAFGEQGKAYANHNQMAKARAEFHELLKAATIKEKLPQNICRQLVDDYINLEDSYFTRLIARAQEAYTSTDATFQSLKTISDKFYAELNQNLPNTFNHYENGNKSNESHANPPKGKTAYNKYYDYAKGKLIACRGQWFQRFNEAQPRLASIHTQLNSFAEKLSSLTQAAVITSASSYSLTNFCLQYKGDILTPLSRELQNAQQIIITNKNLQWVNHTIQLIAHNNIFPPLMQAIDTCFTADRNTEIAAQQKTTGLQGLATYWNDITPQETSSNYIEKSFSNMLQSHLQGIRIKVSSPSKWSSNEFSFDEAADILDLSHEQRQQIKDSWSSDKLMIAQKMVEMAFKAQSLVYAKQKGNTDTSPQLSAAKQAFYDWLGHKSCSDEAE